MTANLLNAYKRKISLLELEPSQGGCFEVTVGDELLYSKLRTGQFPDEAELVREVGERLVRTGGG